MNRHREKKKKGKPLFYQLDTLQGPGLNILGYVSTLKMPGGEHARACVKCRCGDLEGTLVDGAQVFKWNDLEDLLR